MMRIRNLTITALVTGLLVIGLAAAALAATGGEPGDRDRDRDRGRDRVAEPVQIDGAEESVVRERDRGWLQERDGAGQAAQPRARHREHARDDDGCMTREHREGRDRPCASSEDGARAGDVTGRRFHERGCATHPVRRCPVERD